MTNVNLSSDEPTLKDLLARAPLVKTVGDQVLDELPPRVIGVHGAWGAGKTSFLLQLYLYLTGACPQCADGSSPDEQTAKGLWGDKWKAASDKVSVVWFEAWRFQQEPNPVVALLNEIRESLSTWAKGKNFAKKELEVTIAGALFGLENITKFLGFNPTKVQEAGERWEREHYATPLSTHVLRGLLDKAIKDLLGAQMEKGGRLVVIVDDLDRCDPESTYRLLEGIKIYLNIPSCVFVLGMDRNMVEFAVQKRLGNNVGAEDSAFRQTFGRDYVEKICPRIWNLPLMDEPADMLKACLPQDDRAAGLNSKIEGLVREFKCLPNNPRKIKAFAFVLNRFLKMVTASDFTSNHGDLANFTPGTDDSAKLLIVMASLYAFHGELYARIERDPRFYETIRGWAGFEGGVTHPELEGTTRAMNGEKADPKQPTPERALYSAHPDPARGNVFWIQKLLCRLDSVSEKALRAYLLRPVS